MIDPTTQMPVLQCYKCYKSIPIKNVALFNTTERRFFLWKLLLLTQIVIQTTEVRKNLWSIHFVLPRFIANTLTSC